jgi:glycosyltransferase involved in cell wall biosynthesis
MVSTKQLSVIIPVYNERQSIATIIAEVASTLPDVSKEIIVVDDGSHDGTRDWLAQNLNPNDPDRTQLGLGVTGDLIIRCARCSCTCAIAFSVVVVQDADFEYDPADWGRMYDLIATAAQVVFFGSVTMVGSVLYLSRRTVVPLRHNG